MLSNTPEGGGGTYQRSAEAHSYGNLTFDGAGNFTGTVTAYKADDTSATIPVSGTYSVSSSGSVTMTLTNFTPNEIQTGFISSDHNTIVLGEAGRFDAGSNEKILQSVGVAVKK